MKPETQSLVQEIALAMFRVASVVKHEGIKLSLENMAAKLASEESAENIRRAENLVILGREIGNIKEINAAVLLRELANLKSALVPAVDDVDISPVFTSATPVILSEVKNPSNPSATPQDDKMTVISPPSVTPAEKNQDKPPKKTSGQNQAKKHNSINPDKIYGYINEHKVARLKELELAFKEVSGRTVRRITDMLIKDGRIERVGNPGPTSFYRPKIVIPSFPDMAKTIQAAPAPTHIPAIQESSPAIASPSPVIASEAKQSFSPSKPVTWLPL